ncbi:MAG TPA: glycosyltransferase, partial [Acidimicrobiia bacterium]|nr:glycosyltransferase [Acidimicrobiia bacterium]
MSNELSPPGAPAAERPVASRSARWTLGLPFVLLVIAAALVARAPGFSRGLFDPDEAAIATMGMVVQHGGVLYRDVIDRKPPLPALVYAASFWITGSRKLEPLHVLAALELAGAALLVAFEVRRRAGRRAAWWAAGLMVAGAVAFHPVDAQAANYSHLALLPGCGAIVFA